MTVYITAGGRRYCEICHVYVGTNVETRRCISHCQESRCSWCKRPSYGSPTDNLRAECSTHCKAAQQRYQRYLEDQSEVARLQQALEARLAVLTKVQPRD